MLRRISQVLVLLVVVAWSGSAMAKHKSTMFEGVKANKGFVTHEEIDGKVTLTLSDDFVVPEAPDPHWQVVDTKGNVYLLQRVAIKGDKINKTITLPTYVPDVAKVQIWCAFAEVLLGEASFDPPAMVMNKSAKAGK